MLCLTVAPVSVYVMFSRLCCRVLSKETSSVTKSPDLQKNQRRSNTTRFLVNTTVIEGKNRVFWLRINKSYTDRRGFSVSYFVATEHHVSLPALVVDEFLRSGIGRQEVTRDNVYKQTSVPLQDLEYSLETRLHRSQLKTIGGLSQAGILPLRTSSIWGSYIPIPTQTWEIYWLQINSIITEGSNVVLPCVDGAKYVEQEKHAKSREFGVRVRDSISRDIAADVFLGNQFTLTTYLLLESTLLRLRTSHPPR